MKVENIPPELITVSADIKGGSEFDRVTRSAFEKTFPSGEDRTADSILLDAWLSFTLTN